MKSIVLLAIVTGSFWAASAQLIIPDGIKVRVRLSQTVSSATAEQGQAVQLEVAEAIRSGNEILIPEGAVVTGTITEAQEKRRMGRAGKLDFSIDRLRSVDGEWIPLRYTVQKGRGESHVVRTGIITAGVAAVFWPAAPVMLLMKGKDVTVNKGVCFDVFTDTPHKLTGSAGSLPVNAPSASALSPIAGPASYALPLAATVAIHSPLEGADIEIDGLFVGNTPTTIQMQAGTHQVVVRKDSRSWTRTLQVNAGSEISLTAMPTASVITLSKGN